MNEKKVIHILFAIIHNCVLTNTSACNKNCDIFSIFTVYVHIGKNCIHLGNNLKKQKKKLFTAVLQNFRNIILIAECLVNISAETGQTVGTKEKLHQQ